jgi:phospholipase/lecithinase/hemolysin
VAYEYLWDLLTGNPPGSSGGVLPSLLVPVLPPAGAVDFAFGGTGTGVRDPSAVGLFAPGLRGQVELFWTQLAGATPSERALHAIFTGANDYLGSNTLGPSEVVANIGSAVAELYALGARDVIVLGIPDLRLGPAVGANREQLSQISKEHNKLLK